MRRPDARVVKRISACVVSVCLLAALLFAVSYIAAEADHDCIGDACPVCARIELCRSTLGAGFAPGAVPAVCALFVFFTPAALRDFGAVIVRETLVSFKTRLDD